MLLILITNSLFFQQFEFMHDQGSGEVYKTLINGKESTQKLLYEMSEHFMPIMVNTTVSLAFLTKIHPLLGGIGLAGLPVMFRIAKKQNDKILEMRKKERKEEGEIATRIGQTLGGYEEIKTSPHVNQARGVMKEKMDLKDNLSLKRLKESTKTELLHMIPHDISTLIALAVSGALERIALDKI